MNKKNKKSGIGQLFEELVVADLDHFAEFLDAIVSKIMGCDAMFEDGEADACFDPILEGWLPTNNLAEDMARRAYCVAEVLYAIATRSQNADSKEIEAPYYGWPALSKNAKRWCRRIVLMGFPDILPPSALEDLRRANNLIRELEARHFSDDLGNEGGVFAITPRVPLVHAVKDILDRPVDE